MTKTDLIIFDLGRVLVDFDFTRFVRKLQKHTRKSEADIGRYFETTPLWDTFERGRVSPRAFFKQMSQELGVTGLTFEEFQPYWNDIFTEMPETVAVLEKLRGRYRLALLSNVNQMHYEYIAGNHSFMGWFDHPIASYAVGLRKPEHDIFHKALELAGGVRPANALFFDDLEPHILAARQVGIRAHQFTSAEKLRQDLKDLL